MDEVNSLSALLSQLPDWGGTYLHDLSADFLNERKRIFWGYLALSAVLAVLFLFSMRGYGWRSALARVFDKRVFWSGSAKADYVIFAVNRAVSLLISPMLLTQSAVTTTVFFAMSDQSVIGFQSLAGWPSGLIIALYTLVFFLADDLSKYLIHRWMHHWPGLWAFHKVHHSAETMTPITVYRVHPVEGILYGLRGALVVGCVIGVFAFLFGAGALSLYTLLGVNVFAFFFNVAGANLRHSHINIAYWPWLERVLISPAQHQLHHSTATRHFDRNFGAMLAIWDWMFGSLHLSEPEEELTFGLKPHEASATRIADIYLRPFRDLYHMARRRLVRKS